MNILHGVGALCFGLNMAACSTTGPESANFLPSQAANAATVAHTPRSERAARATPRWTCTATGAGMPGKCWQR